MFYHSANSSNLISPSPFLSSVSITSSSCFFVTPAQSTGQPEFRHIVPVSSDEYHEGRCRSMCTAVTLFLLRVSRMDNLTDRRTEPIKATPILPVCQTREVFICEGRRRTAAAPILHII